MARVMLFILVGAALAPGVSRALALVQGQLAPWSVVCSAPTGEPADDGHAARHQLEHCAWCQLHQAQMAPPATMLLPAPALQHAVPPLFLHAPRPLPAWATAQARAPPRSA